MSRYDDYKVRESDIKIDPNDESDSELEVDPASDDSMDSDHDRQSPVL
jgi:hypothetical protein